MAVRLGFDGTGVPATAASSDGTVVPAKAASSAWYSEGNSQIGSNKWPLAARLRGTADM